MDFILFKTQGRKNANSKTRKGCHGKIRFKNSSAHTYYAARIRRFLKALKRTDSRIRDGKKRHPWSNYSFIDIGFFLFTPSPSSAFIFLYFRTSNSEPTWRAKPSGRSVNAITSVKPGWGTLHLLQRSISSVRPCDIRVRHWRKALELMISRKSCSIILAGAIVHIQSW